MTIEEQIQKSVSMADVVAAAVEPDELDDIDKVRDDLQSAKQMLALELRNKEAMERENKRLIARLANLEAELEKEKASRKSEILEDRRPIRTDEDEKVQIENVSHYFRMLYLIFGKSNLTEYRVYKFRVSATYLLATRMKN